MLGAEMAQKTVGELVTERPARSRAFEKLGIDYCCGGKVAFGEACAAKGLDATEVTRQMDAEPTANETDWTKATLTALIQHIVSTHHAYLIAELPRISELAAKVENAHGENHPEVADVRATFEALREELESHLQKEERILFPCIEETEQSPEPVRFPFGSLANPIGAMESEHEGAGVALATLRSLTDDYTPPADACNTFRALLDALQALELDLHQHIHKENNILFPRAIAAETA